MMDPYPHPLHMKVVKHLLYVWRGSGNDSTWVWSLNQCETPSFGTQQGAALENSYIRKKCFQNYFFHIVICRYNVYDEYSSTEVLKKSYCLASMSTSGNQFFLIIYSQLINLGEQPPAAIEAPRGANPPPSPLLYPILTPTLASRSSPELGREALYP